MPHLVKAAGGTLVKADGGHLVKANPPAPSSCPGKPPLENTYDVTWTGLVGNTPTCNIFTTGNVPPPVTATWQAACLWNTGGVVRVNFQLVNAATDYWEIYFQTGFMSTRNYIIATKLFGETPKGVYTVITRNIYTCNVNTIDNITVYDSAP